VDEEIDCARIHRNAVAVKVERTSFELLLFACFRLQAISERQVRDFKRPTQLVRPSSFSVSPASHSERIFLPRGPKTFVVTSTFASTTNRSRRRVVADRKSTFVFVFARPTMRASRHTKTEVFDHLWFKFARTTCSPKMTDLHGHASRGSPQSYPK
jgi:hypothetical protein